MELRDSFPFLETVEVILASPLRRAIQTAAFVFGPVMERRDVPIILVPLAQEISNLRCDIGHDAETIRSEAARLIGEAVPGWNIELLDSTLVDSSWNSKVGACSELCRDNSLDGVQKGVYAVTLRAVQERASEMRKWIYNRSESHVALVTHGGFLHYFAEDWSGYVKSNGICIVYPSRCVRLANVGLQELDIGTASTGYLTSLKNLISESHTFENTEMRRQGNRDPPISMHICFTRLKR